MAVGVVLILISTLYPFRPYLGNLPTFPEWWVSFFRLRKDWVDTFTNIALFMPFGFGLSGWLLYRRSSSLTKLLMVVGASAMLSLGVEVLQVLISRTSSVMDVLTNAFGGGCGYLVFEVARKPIFSTIALTSRLSQRLVARMSLWQLMVAFLGYLALAIVTINALHGFTLSTWDLDAPLFLGGGHTGSHVAWQGQMANLELCDRVLSANDIQPYLRGDRPTLPCDQHHVASYSLRGAAGLQDQARVSPPLIAQGSAPPQPSELGTRLSGQGWLRSQTGDTVINQRIQQSSQFTLAVTVTPDTIQPRRDVAVLSMTSNHDLGNLQIIQVDSHLVFWLRNISTKQAGIPQGFVQNVLQAGRPCRIVLTYAGLSLQAYVEGLANPVVFNLLPNNYQVIFYLAFYPPLGIILSAIVRRCRRERYWLVMAMGCVLPPVVLELLQAGVAHRPVRLSNLLLSIVIVAATSLLAQWISRKSETTSITPRY